MSKIYGSCLCGAVSYSVSAAPVSVVNCHCNMCRHMSGSTFNSYVVVRESDCEFNGATSLAEYAVSERATKYFCSRCGSSVFNKNPSTYPGVLMLYLGSLADAHKFEPRVNIFCESMLSWVKRIAEIKSFPTAPRTGN